MQAAAADDRVHRSRSRLPHDESPNGGNLQLDEHRIAEVRVGEMRNVASLDANQRLAGCERCLVAVVRQVPVRAVLARLRPERGRLYIAQLARCSSSSHRATDADGVYLHVDSGGSGTENQGAPKRLTSHRGTCILHKCC